ncbi:hypothetical protein BGZ91_011253 [Linnemannia elongata]|nr:hypothetical protein BGZ91_011253 [Linnemannia elongata]
MPAPTPGLQSISDLTTTSRITTGDIPPPLVGATMTIVDDKLFLFGGRLIQNRQMTNSLFVLNLNDFHWQNVSEIVNVTPKRAIGDPGAEDENEMGAPPTERYFHSANAYKNTIVIFGGMGPSSSGSAEGQPQDLVVFDDIKVLDLELLQWRQVRIPSSPHAPKPRYAHLSSVSGNKLVIIGGQDISNQYIEEVSVLDLDSLQWVASMPFEKHCGSYRSIAVSGSGKGSFMPLIGSEAESLSPTISPTSVTSDGFPTSYLRKTPSNTSLHYTPSLRRSSSNLALSKKGAHMSRLSIGSGGLATSPPSTSDQRTSVYRLSQSMTSTSPVQQEENPVYIYSNFNFTDVKRELQVLTPPGFVTQDHSHSMTGNVLPPGLRFPTGAIAGQHLLLSGTYLTNAHQSFSIWSLNLSSLAWTRIDTGTVFSTGSWNRGLLLENSNAYLVFGNKSRSLADDYQNRQTNFEHVSIVDLEAFGIYQHPPTTMTQTAQELGLSLLNDPSMADFEILTQDDQRIPVNSATAALSQQIGLQIRSLKVMIAAKKMLQQQQLKLQQQQSLSQSISANNAWSSSEPYHPNGGAGSEDPSHYSPYSSSSVNGHAPYLSQQHSIHGLFQPNPPPPLSPTSINGPPSPDYNRLSLQGSTALPHPMLRNRGSVIGTMPPQHWNTEPLTPPPVSPPPPAAAVPSTPPTATKSSFFSFPGSKNKSSNVASSGASTRSGSSTSTKRGVPAFASMGVAPITGVQSDTASVKSGKSGSGSEVGDKKKPDEAAKKEVIQKLMDTSFLSMGGGGVGGGMMGPFGGR